MNSAYPRASHDLPSSVTNMAQLSLWETEEESSVNLNLVPYPCVLESEEFPFEVLSDIAELESWRKEINRPTYHIHKWWAQRLGTVFRAILLGAFTPKGSNLLDLFYQPVRIPEAVVFDPFMGSGTTIGEALKMGVQSIGRDINPVAHFLVKNALTIHNREAIQRTFVEIERDVADRIRRFYYTRLPNGETVEVLYYFWVKHLDCPMCTKTVDLFPSYIFAKHAYPKRYPESQAVCPDCGTINEIAYNAESTDCIGCQNNFNPQSGPARGQNAHCPHCAHIFPISKTIRKGQLPPKHRLYAKLVMMPDGTKAYLSATEYDQTLYSEAEQELDSRADAYPVVQIQPGYNTNQVLGYNYNYWYEMFNARQLLCLSILAERIKQVQDSTVRDLFACLFSGALEFNNMFASYKGEGTGAVRNMFSHHILKPERMPLEANLWGTSKSSGSFSTIFEGRIRRALDYAKTPFELRVIEKDGRKIGEKVYGLSESLDFQIAQNFTDLQGSKRLYLSCGDSSKTDLPDQSVDAIITDPPFFDNVHYSQLADFFHVWQRYILGCDGNRQLDTTRSEAEVQNGDSIAFTDRLSSVLREANRVLKNEGLLAFTYHHSRSEGWSSVLCAIMQAGFIITAVQPIKAEMSGAVPKSQATEPINLDIIIVCRKRIQLELCSKENDLWSVISSRAKNQVDRLKAAGRSLSRNDIRVIVTAHFIQQLSIFYSVEEALCLLTQTQTELEIHIGQLHKAN